jgi:hypothetical protein
LETEKKKKLLKRIKIVSVTAVILCVLVLLSSFTWVPHVLATPITHTGKLVSYTTVAENDVNSVVDLTFADGYSIALDGSLSGDAILLGGYCTVQARLTWFWKYHVSALAYTGINSTGSISTL